MQLPQTFNRYKSIAIIISWLILVTVFLPVLHNSLLGHLFVGIPALVFCGYLMGNTFFNEPLLIAKWNKSGIPLMVLASLWLIFWMIPRFLDASIQQGDWYWLKIISVTFLCGLPISWSVKKLSYISFNFFRIELIATLFRMAWLFITAKERLCLNYLYSEQMYVGNTFLLLAIICCVWPATRVIFGQHNLSVAHSNKDLIHEK